MTRSRFIAVLLLTVFAVGYAGSADAQFWKRKKHRKHHQQKNKAAEGVKEKAAEDGNEEDERSVEETEQGKTRSQLKKEKKEQKRKEKKARKEKELQEKREKKERKAKEDKERKEKKNKGKKKSKGPVKEEPVAEQPVIRKWKDIEYAPTQKKAHYRIDILAPMYLDELVKNGYAVRDIPEKAVAGINFYKGVQIAADTLKKASFDIDIYVHDVASLLESTEMLVRKNMLDSSDLIIGAVAAKDVPSLAAYAKTKQINFISAASPADGNVKDNQYFTLLQPSLRSNCEWITGDIQANNQTGKALLLYRTSVQGDESAYRYFTDDAGSAAIFKPLICNSLPKRDVIAALIDTTKVNTVVVSVTDNTYADSLLRILKNYFPSTHFSVYGMPGWTSMASISKPGMFPNLTINVPVPFNFTTITPQTSYVDRVFRKEYGGKPMEMVYRGYETMFWYANMLARYGTIFNKHYEDNETAPFTKFQLKPQWDKQGNVLYQENRSLYLRKYDNGTYITRQ